MGKKTSMTRRAFTKLAAATAIAATVSLEGAQALGATAGEKTAVPEVKRIRTACRGCGKMAVSYTHLPWLWHLSSA